MPDSTDENGQLSDFDKELNALCEKHEVVTLDQLVREVQGQNFLINNLFESWKGGWRCSLRKVLPGEKEDFYEYGDGDNPEDALLNAMYNAELMLTKSHMAARKKLRR